jgi:putative hydrolase of the HAD superfamily
VKALLIDLDDTLLDYSGGVDECWLGACSLAPANVDPASLVAAIDRARRWFWSDPERHRRERVNMMAAWRKLASHALEELGASDEALATVIAEDFAERRWKSMTLFPGVTDGLETLKRRGVPMALVTNGDASHQRRKIEQHDLRRFFDVILIEGEFGTGKPDETVYRHVLDALGTRPADAWMVGDHLEWDVLAPQRLGLCGVWIDAEGRGLPEACPVAPHRIIRRFVDFLAD